MEEVMELPLKNEAGEYILMNVMSEYKLGKYTRTPVSAGKLRFQTELRLDNEDLWVKSDEKDNEHDAEQEACARAVKRGKPKDLRDQMAEVPKVIEENDALKKRIAELEAAQKTKK